MEIIDNVKIVQRKDSPIIGIVQAEALYYFDGQKSMKETIDTMKNRIEIYEKENSTDPDMCPDYNLRLERDGKRMEPGRKNGFGI